MKFFKTEAKRNAERYIINVKSFKARTDSKYPFVQRSDEELRAYGICPCCLNPIQIIGILKEIKVKPYGKHTGENVNGFPNWNYIKYKYCPFASGKCTQPRDDEPPLPIDDSIIDLYELLKTQFDRVIYLVEKELHIRCTPAFWKTGLSIFVNSELYRYPWLTEANLPYVFAYFAMQQSNCIGQSFKRGTEIYKALEKYPNAKFVKTKFDNYDRLSNDGCFLRLHFRLTDHRYKAVEGETLKESMKFCIDDISQNSKTIFEQRIEFDETYFMNLINKSDNDGKRQQWLLDIAGEIMTGIG